MRIAVWRSAALLALTLPAVGAEVPFDLIENHIYLPVTVAGTEREWILDTGAGGSVIDEAYAREFGLAQAEGEALAVGASGAVTAAFVKVPELAVAGIELGDRAMVALDIAALLRSRAGTEPGGILGYDFLARYVTRIDYAQRTISFIEPDRFEYQGPGSETPMRLEANIPAVRLTVEDSIVGWWRLDTGASFPSFHGPSVVEFGLADRTGVETVAGGVGGASRSNLVRFDRIELAGHVIKDPIIAVPLEATRGALASPGFVGTLGASVLRNFVVYLDYPGRRVILEPGDEFGRRPALDRSGLTLAWDDTLGLRALHVAPGTPAEQAGFATGDRILAVDGRTPDEIGGVRRVRELLRAEPGSVYAFRVRRNQAELELKLSLAELFE